MLTRIKREKFECDCGQRIAKGSEKAHEAGGRHQEWLRVSNVMGGSLTPPTSSPELPEDLDEDDQLEEESTPVEIDSEIQSVMDSNQSPVNKAKGLRRIFSYRDWPDDDHPATVRQILIQSGVPIHETADGSDESGSRKIRAQWERTNK